MAFSFRWARNGVIVAIITVLAILGVIAGLESNKTLTSTGTFSPQGGEPRVNSSQDSTPAARKGQVVMLIIDRVTLKELTDQSLPNFQNLLRLGAMGLMNTNVVGPRIPDNTYAALGAGSRIQTSPVGGEAYNDSELYYGERAGQVYQRRLGLKAEPDSVVHLQLPKILMLNADQKYTNQPGALGTVLHQAGLRTGVLGNADTAAAAPGIIPHGRAAVTIAMDKWGRVDQGVVDQTLLKPDPAFAWGLATDYNALWQAYKTAAASTDFLVVELGDTTRADDAMYQSMAKVAANQKGRALRQADLFLGRIMADLEISRQLLMVVVPTPSNPAVNEKLLMTPVIMAGPGISNGLLTTPTTKRPGLVTNIDIAPTVLDYFNLPVPPTMQGQGMTALAFSQPAERLSKMEREINFTYVVRPVLAKGYVLTEIIAICMAMSTIFLGRPRAVYTKRVLLALMAAPLSLLLFPIFPQLNDFFSVVIVIGVTALIVAVGLWLGQDQELEAFIYICLATAFCILGDTLLGAPLLKESPLSYDPRVGARFYGIGNEYMGVLLGAA
ncbi:MAG TPA: hypothetical protein VHS59_14730, partial [Bacillota bacterium]|nr:hypothetical protein [Bacillota bacterium]